MLIFDYLKVNQAAVKKEAWDKLGPKCLRKFKMPLAEVRKFEGRKFR